MQLVRSLRQQLAQLSSELKETKAYVSQSDQQAAVLSAKVSELDESLASEVERREAAEAQAIRLVESINEKQGETQYTETELTRKVKMMEADKIVLKQAMDGQISALMVPSHSLASNRDVFLPGKN